MSSATGSSAAGTAEVGQQHPIGLYLKIWALLFVLSGFSYAVDYFQFQGYLRWILIITFMWAKAGLIVSIFMHMAWERLALIFAILLPPAFLLVLVGMMAIEGGYTTLTRMLFFGSGS
jgi:cytochrome c oxidase subunit 4